MPPIDRNDTNGVGGMIWLYNAFRAAARGGVAGAAGVLLNGKAEPLSMHFDGEQATLLSIGLLTLAWLMFCAESWCKKRAGL
jgi:hypothetical protein